VVGGFVVTILVIIAGIALGSLQPELISDVAAIYSGVVGAVIGYFFGRSESRDEGSRD
jgi:hypothetical protein